MIYEIYHVYLIENNINDKKYVGYTKNGLKKRFYQHSKSNKVIGTAIRFHGIDNFSIKTLDMCDTLDEAVKLEIQRITEFDTFKTGYNCSRGGETHPTVHNKAPYKTKEFSEKCRERALEQYKDPEKKKNHIEGIKHYWKTLDSKKFEIRKNIAIENGKKSDGSTRRGKKFPGTGLGGEKNPMAKKYKVIFPDGTEKIIMCLLSFCKLYALTYRNAQGVLEGKQKHHKGFKFARLENHS